MRTRVGVCAFAMIGLLACESAGKSTANKAPPPVARVTPADAGGTQTERALHGVVVKFHVAADFAALQPLEDQLSAAIAAAKVGEFDGDEVALDGSGGSLYMYGPDADRLFEVVRPILEASPLMKGATVVKRYGPPEAKTVKETRVTLPVR